MATYNFSSLLNRPMTRRSMIGASLLAMSALAGCGGSSDPLSGDSSGSTGSSGDTIIVGSADFAESQLIATIYSHALANAGVTVEEKLGIGAREVYIEALNDGSIDLVPEYSGTLLSYYDESAAPSTADEVITQLGELLPDGLAVLEASEATDGDTVTVTKAFAEEHGITKISDLSGLSEEMTFGGPAEIKTRYMGLVGLEELYGLTFKDCLVLDAGGPLTLAALTGGQIQAGDMFSSDPAIEDNDLIALEDDKALFGFQQVLPLGRADKLTDTVTEVLNKISAALTTEGLMDLNRRSNNGDDFADIADDWIAENLK